MHILTTTKSNQYLSGLLLWLSALTALTTAIISCSQACAGQTPVTKDSALWNNVRTFGAKGDGRDDSAAFHAAIKAGRRVYIPAGRYRVNIDLSTIPDPNGLILMGDGYGNGTNGTVLEGYDESLPVIRGEFSKSSIIRKLKFTDFSINQTRGKYKTIENDGIRFQYVYEVVYENIYFINLGGWCVNLNSCIAHSFFNCQFFSGYSSYGLGGLKATNHSNLLNIFGGRFTGSGVKDHTPAFSIGEIDGVKLFGCSVESWGNGIVLDNIKGKIVDISIDAYFEENNQSDVRIGTNKDDNTGNPIIGVKVRGTFAGPVNKNGYALELYGKKLYAITFNSAYVTNRDAVINLADEILLDGVQIGHIYHDGVKLLKGTVRHGIYLAEEHPVNAR